MPDTTPGLMTVFTEALERADPADRAAYLDRACAGNAALRRRVDELLAAHPGVGRFLEPDAPSAAESSARDATAAFNPSLATGDFAPDAATGTFGDHTRATEPDWAAGAPVNPGAIIAGRYTLTEVIGEGGMGSVYLATQTEPVKRQVALKLIKAGMDSKSVLARFDAERQALALMDHPNIARIYDGGVTPAGQPFFVMELVEGVPLTAYCDANRLTVDVRLQLFVQVCQAVQHAHQKGVIHRDLKPGNVLVTEVDGRPTPKVIDFGVAKATEQKLTDLSFSDTGAIVGTPAYMSPEQADPTSMDIDTRTDVYALGVMLYELLTGSPPIDGKQFKRGAILEMLRMVREVEPPRPSTKLSTAVALPNIAANRSIEPAKLAKLLHGELDWVVMKALEKDRTRRYESANAFAADVQRYLADEVVEARPPSRGYRLKKFVKRNKVQVTAVSFVLLALLGGIVGTSLGMIEAGNQAEKASAEAKAARKAEDDADREAKAARTAEGEALRQKGRAEESLRKAEWSLYASKLLLAQTSFTANYVPAAYRLLGESKREMRGWEHAHLRWRFQSSKQTLKGHFHSIHGLAWSPDGQRILTGGEDSTAKVWDAERGTDLLTLKGHTHIVTSVCWSPDGQRLLTGSYDNSAKVWDANTGNEILTLKGHTGHLTSVCWSPDGQRLLTASRDKTARAWDAKTGNEILTIRGHTNFLISGSWSPDGKRILTASDDDTARVWDATTGKELLTLNGPTRVLTSVAWSPDSQRILTGSRDKTARVWDAKTGNEILTIRGHTQFVNSVAWSPDGQRILTGSRDCTARVWDAERGTEMLIHKGHAKAVLSVAWSPDGQRIVTGSVDKTAKVWDAEKSQEVLTFKEHTSTVECMAWSPDGQRIVTGSVDRTAKVWDAKTGQAILTFKGHTLPVGCVAWSPDGQRIVTGSVDKTAKVWDAKTGNEILTIKGHTQTVFDVAWSPDGQHILTGSWEIFAKGEAGVAKLWEAETGKEVLSLKGHTGALMSLQWSPDGQRILTGSQDCTARVWDAKTGQETLTIKGHTLPVLCVSWSPDGRRIVTGSWDHTARVWDAKTGQETLTITRPLGAPFKVNSVSWSPDGRRILTGSWNDSTPGDPTEATLWDAETGQEVMTLKGHTREVRKVAWSPDGQRIVTGSVDKTAMVWEADTSEVVLILEGTDDLVRSVAWSTDGTTVYAWDDAGKLLAWDSVYGHSVPTKDAPPRPAPGPALSPDGRFFAKPDGYTVAVVDTKRPAVKSSPWPFPTAAERTAYHTAQAAVAEKEQKWFAVAFHVGRVLLDDPQNAALKNRREEALKKHASREVAPPPAREKK